MQLDAGRLNDLRIFSESELAKIGRAAIQAIAEQLDALERALTVQDLAAVRDSAHRARNETLLVGAHELCDALASIEDAARTGHDRVAREAATAARELWPPTREAIARETHATG